MSLKEAWMSDKDIEDAANRRAILMSLLIMAVIFVVSCFIGFALGYSLKKGQYIDEANEATEMKRELIELYYDADKAMSEDYENYILDVVMENDDEFDTRKENYRIWCEKMNKIDSIWAENL